jgi:hypothetical protein
LSQCTATMSAITPTDEPCAADPNKPTGPIKILIADDHPIFRDGLQKLLRSNQISKWWPRSGTGMKCFELSRNTIQMCCCSI